MRAVSMALLLWASGPLGAAAAPNLKLIQLPPGFQITVFADNLERPRVAAFAPDGNLFVTEMGSGRVSLLPDTDADGRADQRVTFAAGLDRPHGLAFYKGALYVGETDKVTRFAYKPGQRQAAQKSVVVPDLPKGGGHFTRTVVFGPDDRMYVSIGSTCNVCIEKDQRRATVMQFKPDGSGGRIYARGLRNAVGLAFDAQKRFWATSNGRDNLGDDQPPDELHLLQEGLNAGWPFCHAGKYRDPEYGRADSCERSTPPVWGFQAHSAPLGLSAYTGSQFPAEYRRDLFVAFHGSWNRSAPTGYKVVRVHVEAGKPVRISDFATGWLRPDLDIIGRPVAPVVGPDGSLFVTDDGAGVIYRIRYSEQQASAPRS